jgi:O-antigen ligase
MNKALTRKKILSSFTGLLYIIFFTSFIFSFRAITSISTGLILLCGIMENKRGLRAFFLPMIKNPFFIACFLFFLLQVISLLYTHSQKAGWDNIRLKSGLLFIPLAFCGMDRFPAGTRRKLWAVYCLLLAGASLYCLFLAGWHYRQVHDPSLFFYHALVSPFSHHAVYFSIFVFTALVFLLENAGKGYFLFRPFFTIVLVVYFSVFLFLLSSKLVIAFYIIYLLYYFILLLKKKTNRAGVLAVFILFVVAGGSASMLHNPVSNRFYEILNGDMKLVNQDKFDKGNYFNGLQFRMLQWKFVPEILTGTHSWWTGVSPGDAQSLLDQQYISKDMYTGDPAKKTTGYLGYNTHNQFLEALLQTGIPGFLAFLLTCFCLVRMAAQKKDSLAWFIILLLLVYSCTESVFETQYSILLFTFFPLFAGTGDPAKTGDT